jgi:hypothetical protein
LLLLQKYKKASRACKQELLDATVVEAAAWMRRSCSHGFAGISFPCMF